MPDTDLQKLRDRLYNINDWKQTHVQEVAVLTHRVQVLEDERSVFATKEQLSTSMATVALQIQNAATTVGLQIGHLRDDIDPIKKALYWSISIVLAAVIAAVMALILKR